jgi:hypothetical protein
MIRDGECINARIFNKYLEIAQSIIEDRAIRKPGMNVGIKLQEHMDLPVNYEDYEDREPFLNSQIEVFTLRSRDNQMLANLPQQHMSEMRDLENP